MALPDFEYEFTNEIENLSPQLETDLRLEAEERLHALAREHNDVIGAAVSLENLTEGDETPHLFRARAVLYSRPEQLAGVAKESDPTIAMKAALDAVERQLRDRRAQFSDRNRNKKRVDAEGLYELSAQEIYQAFTDDSLPDVWLERSRDDIASELMVEEELNLEDAYYAADQILAHAQEIS